MIEKSKHIQDIEEEPTVKALRFISLNLGAMAVAYAIFYLGPSSWVRVPRNQKAMSEQISLVQNIDRFGPVWTFLFALIGILIILTIVRGRWVIYSHGIAAGAWVFYGAAILFGAVLSEPPPTTILPGAAAIFSSITHAGMARAWAGEGVK